MVDNLGGDTGELPSNWEAVAWANVFLERIRRGAPTDPDIVLRTIAGLIVSQHGEPGWTGMLTAEDLRRMMNFREAWAQDPDRSVAGAPFVSEIVKAGPVVTKLVFHQLMVLHRTEHPI
jgi:hypothetical protein